jgi:hypothetical protein
MWISTSGSSSADMATKDGGSERYHGSVAREIHPKKNLSSFHTYLVGGFNHLEKYQFVNGKDDIPYMKWKIRAMFETTNQI